MTDWMDRRLRMGDASLGRRMQKLRVLSLRTYVLIAAAILLLPLLLVGVLAAAYHFLAQQQEVEHSAEDAAYMVAAAFDAETEVYRTAFRALAAFPDITSLSPTQLQERMQVLLSKPQPDLFVSVAPGSAEGDTFGSGANEIVSDWDRGPEGIHSTLSVSPSGEASLRLMMRPLSQTGDVVMLRMHVVLQRFSQHLKELIDRGNYVVSIYDRDGRLVSSSGATKILPKQAVEQIVATNTKEGRLTNVGTDGSDYVTFWQNMPDSQQHLVVSLRRDVSGIPVSGLLLLLVAVCLLPLLGGLISATFLTRILSVAQEQVLKAAAAMGQGGRMTPLQTPLKEANVVGQTLVEASARLKDSARALQEVNECLERRIQERTSELHQKSQLIEETLNSLDQGIIHFDGRGKILLANHRAEQLLAEPGVRDITLDSWARIASSAEPVRGVSFVVEHLLPDGRSMEIRRTELADGSTVCLLGDVSDRVRQADELQRARMQAEEASRAKDDFLANMSHELRTPLTAILGYADLLILDPSLGEVNQERIRRLRGAGHGLLTLLNDVLDYARITAGELSICHKSFELVEVVQDALSVVEPLALEKSLALEVDLDDALPRRLMGDPNRIRQILINLLNNAVKFTHIGFIKLSVQAHGTDDDGAVMLQFCVEDSGIGIPLDQQDRVFDRFHQADRCDDALYRGAGLGLSICRQLIELMGGKIWLRSSPETGTSFMVSLSLSPGGCDIRQASEVRGMAHARILLADDVEIGRDVTAQLLEAFCVKVDCVSNGVEATRAVAEQLYDLVILDLNMPKMGGHEAARLIRQSPLTRHIPIIACSASPPTSESSPDERFYDEFLCKPLDAPTVHAMLRRHITARGREQFLANAPPSPSSPSREQKSLEDLIGAARVGSGLDQLESHLDELLSLDLTVRENAIRVCEICHAAVTSARLLELDELFDCLLRLNDRSLEAEQLLSLAADSQPVLIRLRNELADYRRSRMSRT